MRNSIIPIFIPHLGCPNDCVFCNQRRIATPHEPSPDEVAAIIEEGLEHTKEPQISFYGGSFTAIDRDLMISYLKAAAPFVEKGLCDSIRLSTRPDAIGSEILDILKEYRVKTIELGAQSMDDDVLRLSARGHRADSTVRASKLIKKYNFELILQMMVGLPGSGEGQEIATALALRELNPDGVRIYPTCVIKDTPLCDMYLRGEYEALTVDRAVELCAEILPIFQQRDIPVIRLGLNPTEELSTGGVCAGAYHPALGEMVYSRIFYNAMVPRVPKDRPYELVVPPKMLSIAIGQKKSNLNKLRHISDLKSIRADNGVQKPEIRAL